MIAVRTHIAVRQQATNVVIAGPTKAVKPFVQESNDIQVMVLSKVMFVQL
jgi:hypothetical protein